MSGMVTSLTSLCQKYFQTKDLYSVLGIPKTATEKEVKNAYRRKCLQFHPDRVEQDEKEECTEKFKVIAKIHALLSDKDKRRSYDDSGNVEEDEETDWTQYWKLIFKTITEDDIANYEKKYKDSEEERGDLKDVYLQSEGNMDMIMDMVLFAKMEDEPRLSKILQGMIDSGEVPDHPQFSQESREKKLRRKRKFERRLRQFHKMQEAENESMSSSDLTVALAANQKSRESQFSSFMDSLEQKYAPKKKNKKSDDAAKPTRKSSRK